MKRNETLFPKKIILVRCFDPDIDIPILFIKKALEKHGCDHVRDMRLAGGAISFGRHFNFCEEQLQVSPHTPSVDNSQ
jgi:hypothetical protein